MGVTHYYDINSKSPRKMLPHDERFWREAGGHQHMDQGLQRGGQAFFLDLCLIFINILQSIPLAKAPLG